MALNSLTTSLSNFAGTMTSPAMASAASVMSSFASQIGSWAEGLAKFQKEHPDVAKVLGAGALGAGTVAGGVLTYQLLSGLTTGFGLSGSAAALDASAAALTEAAGALAGGNLAKDAAKVAGGASFSLGATAATLLPPALGAGSFLVINGADQQTQKKLVEAIMQGEYGVMPSDTFGRDYTLGSGRTFGPGADGSWQPAPHRTRLGAPDMFGPYTELKTRAAEAGEAGTEAGSSFRTNLKTELDQAVTDVSQAVAKMRGLLNFNASPTITPNINMPAAPSGPPGKSAALTGATAKHAAFADYGFDTA